MKKTDFDCKVYQRPSCLVVNLDISGRCLAESADIDTMDEIVIVYDN